MNDINKNYENNKKILEQLLTSTRTYASIEYIQTLKSLAGSTHFSHYFD